MPEEFTQIGSTGDCAFWSALPSGGKLYFGSYGYPRVYNCPPWTHLANLPAGESIPRMTPFGGKSYCVTENKGHIYRMDSPTNWARVHDDSWPWGLGMAALGSYIYGSFNKSGEDETKTLYSSNGTSWPVADDWVGGQIWVLVAFGNYVYEIGQKKATKKTWARRGTGTSWADVAALCLDTVGFWDVGFVFNGKLYLGMGRRSDGKVKIFRFDGTNLSGEVFSVSAFYAHYACIHDDNKMYWLFGPFMNQGSTATVYYHLYRTATGNPGDWEHVKTFSTHPISSHGKYRTRGCVGSSGGNLYVAIQNKVYKMGPPPTYDCPLCPATFDSSAELDTHIIAKHPGQVIEKVFYHQKENSGWIEKTGRLVLSTVYNDIRIRNKPAYNLDNRGFLSFDTSSIPENAVIQSAFIKVMGVTRYSGASCVVDYSLYGSFDAGDWGRVPEQANIASQPTAPNAWRESSRFTQVNKGGISQYRIHEPTASTAFGNFYAGNSPQQPELHVRYMIPAPVEEITCPSCKARLRVTRSPVPEENLDLTCPLCEAPIGTGIKVEVLEEGPIIKELREAIRTLDEETAKVEERLAVVRSKIERIKEILGL